jgi:hypothetical protein
MRCAPQTIENLHLVPALEELDLSENDVERLEQMVSVHQRARPCREPFHTL